MTPAALAAIGMLAAALQGLTLLVLTWMRDDIRSLVRRVGEHDAFITALKMREKIGG